MGEEDDSSDVWETSRVGGVDATGVDVSAGTSVRAGTASPSEFQSSGSDDLIIVSPEEPTVMSVGNVGPTRLIEELAAEDNEPVSNTHFQTVNDAKADSGVFANRQVWAEQSFLGWGKIVGMASILVLGGVLFFWAMQTPSPDELYIDALSGNSTAMQAFLQLYPDDPRHTEVEDLQMGIKLRGVLKRLNAQSKLGITDLSASEESFVRSMQDRELNPTQAAGKIEQWLAVYDADVTDPELREMVELAKREQQRLLERAPLNAIDKRAGSLLTRIRLALQSDDPEQVRKELSGIIVTFESIDWAKPAVDEAKRQLDKLEATQDRVEESTGGSPNASDNGASSETGS